jgi:hypothetical protein
MLIFWLVSGLVLILAVLVLLRRRSASARRDSHTAARNACMGGEDDC